MIWSDETKINRLGIDEAGRILADKKETGLEVHSCVGTTKSGGGNIMIRGCMTADGVGFAKFVEERINSKHYIEILNACLPSTLEKFDFERERAIFQQDNDQMHTSKMT